MLTSLRIKDLGVISSSTLDFEPGMTVLTGETGAGKTMIVSGLGLLLGARSDSGLVRLGSQKCLVEGTFDADKIVDELGQCGAEIDDGEVLFVRQISKTGRSRSFAGGVQIPLGKLGALTGELATLHGQSEQIRLGTSERQRQVLDHAAAHEQLLEEYRELYALRAQTRDELTEVRNNAQARAREHDVLAYGLDEIEKVDPQPGEDKELAAEAARLQAVDDLRTLAARANRALSGSPSGDIDEPGASGLLFETVKALEQVADLDESGAQLAEAARQASFAVEDLSSSVASYLANLEGDPLRLEAIGQRRAKLQELTRKYGDSIDDVLAWAQNASKRVLELSDDDSKIAKLSEQLAKIEAKLLEVGKKLSTSRKNAADRLAEKAMGELTALALPHARLVFHLDPLDEPGPWGLEKVQLLFSANPGSKPAPLAKVASGGELSRVRLALEVVLAAGDEGHVFVFDEVDAGVGGAVATEIGRRLAMLAKHSQVIVVTHLAQVAAFGDAHYVIAKSSDGEVTTSGVTRLDDEARLTELARMMGGSDTKTALAHAKELRQQAEDI
ncbi:DNA repair protein RecN [Propionimicrobium sp. BV2F7]|uniref:DNA repair protein RecN n=1 Tax=Propionimicrobium TaxID=203133 RepID=UPI0003D79AD7|nr:DNA repair protein RecN [Propionimicrobium sp. BV2F7]ETJ97805.1 DNA repair protein RecN [Propionimicrobium sp. BV2F7]